MFGELEDILTLVFNYRLRKKSGLSSGGMILPFLKPPPLRGRFGRPAINQATAPRVPINKIIKTQAHFGRFLISSWGVRTQSASVYMVKAKANTTGK